MVFVVLLSVTVLRKRYSVLQYLAVGLIVCGLLGVTFVDIYASGSGDVGRDSSDRHSVIIGMLALLGGQFFHASHAILEEHILTRAAGQEPLYMMGWEGIFGLMITMMLLVPAQMLTCPFDDVQCVNGHVDDIFLAS